MSYSHGYSPSVDAGAPQRPGTPLVSRGGGGAPNGAAAPPTPLHRRESSYNGPTTTSDFAARADRVARSLENALHLLRTDCRSASDPFAALALGVLERETEGIDKAVALVRSSQRTSTVRPAEDELRRPQNRLSVGSVYEGLASPPQHSNSFPTHPPARPPSRQFAPFSIPASPPAASAPLSPPTLTTDGGPGEPHDDAHQQSQQQQRPQLMKTIQNRFQSWRFPLGNNSRSPASPIVESPATEQQPQESHQSGESELRKPARQSTVDSMTGYDVQSQSSAGRGRRSEEEKARRKEERRRRREEEDQQHRREKEERRREEEERHREAERRDEIRRAEERKAREAEREAERREMERIEQERRRLEQERQRLEEERRQEQQRVEEAHRRALEEAHCQEVAQQQRTNIRRNNSEHALKFSALLSPSSPIASPKPIRPASADARAQPDDAYARKPTTSRRPPPPDDDSSSAEELFDYRRERKIEKKRSKAALQPLMLPDNVISTIIKHASGNARTLSRLSLVSKNVNAIAMPQLLANVSIGSLSHVAGLARAFRRNPEAASYVKSLEVGALVTSLDDAIPELAALMGLCSNLTEWREDMTTGEHDITSATDYPLMPSHAPSLRHFASRRVWWELKPAVELLTSHKRLATVEFRGAVMDREWDGEKLKKTINFGSSAVRSLYIEEIMHNDTLPVLLSLCANSLVELSVGFQQVGEGDEDEDLPRESIVDALKVVSSTLRALTLRAPSNRSPDARGLVDECLAVLPRLERFEMVECSETSGIVVEIGSQDTLKHLPRTLRHFKARVVDSFSPIALLDLLANTNAIPVLETIDIEWADQYALSDEREMEIAARCEQLGITCKLSAIGRSPVNVQKR